MIVMLSARRLKPGAFAFVENEHVSGVYEVIDVLED